MRLPILLLAALVISCDGVSIAPFALEPCHIDGLGEEIRCGVREVFEDRDNQRAAASRFTSPCCRRCGGSLSAIRCS